MSPPGQASYSSKASSSFVDLFSKRKAVRFLQRRPGEEQEEEDSSPGAQETMETVDEVSANTSAMLSRNKTLPSLVRHIDHQQRSLGRSRTISGAHKETDQRDELSNKHTPILSPLLSQGLAALDRGPQGSFVRTSRANSSLSVLAGSEAIDGAPTEVRTATRSNDIGEPRDFRSRICSESSLLDRPHTESFYGSRRSFLKSSIALG